ncbi:molybdenum cofactor biosynthesis protein A [Emticicia oligotrophica DSM 17448]|uniref:GTP 3',8-cyclase n=1 Tax=Emticicia oligotrophica (strain DSM 17448 / CIP 109782 / MTCC 6937 / GPTSA100-15) TaxID=929562 RepID=A0ABM5N140_EMTOG|nr:GTP 3',8-cyclase MoaA [Emticicia oligotrophica]AFK03137.1 molybdenum cofactor biosynthesis protein A [Emticicia oligotrophica DSM 17448]
MLIDNHGRPINYLRLAITDRCNLRCFYCMPEEGIQYLPKPHLLSYEEMLRLCRILAEMGISKVRITGGEPFVRRDIIPFLWKLSEIEGIEKINITTNGVLTAPLVPELKQIGISSVNLSLDSLDRQRFFEITRRDEFPKVWATLEALLAHDIPVKVNTVVMAGKNDADILSMVELARNQNVSVRFIEEMPFNGEGLRPEQMEFWSYRRIIDLIRSEHLELYKLQDEPNSTSYNYHIPNFKGTIGVIAAFSRTFCGTCNRIRVTPTGSFRTCLYDDGVFNVRDFMRQKLSDEEIKQRIYDALQNRAKDGFEAENRRSGAISESMTTIGG